MFNLGDTLEEVHNNMLPAAKLAEKKLEQAMDILGELEQVDGRFGGVRDKVIVAYLQTASAIMDIQYSEDLKRKYASKS